MNGVIDSIDVADGIEEGDEEDEEGDPFPHNSSSSTKLEIRVSRHNDGEIRWWWAPTSSCIYKVRIQQLKTTKKSKESKIQ